MNWVIRRERKPTELWKDAVALVIQDVDDYGNIGTTFGKSIGGNGSGQSHSTTGEDREDGGETHSD